MGGLEFIGLEFFLAHAAQQGFFFFIGVGLALGHHEEVLFPQHVIVVNNPRKKKKKKYFYV